MAAPVSERLFSLELLVDWVRLEARLTPPPPPVVEAEEEREQEEEASPPPSRSLCPAVAFRLLDFPTLLVYPRGGPAAPAPEPRPGLLSFGRGKSCLFRLPPATLRRRLLETPLYSLLLQLPPGRPTPAPQLLGTCSISLAVAAREVLGPVASGCSHGHRGNFPLHNHVGERIGDISLAYRLTDLGGSLLGHLQRPVISTEGGEEGAEVWETAEVRSQAQQEKPLQQPGSDPSPRDADRPLQGLKHPKAQEDLKETVFHSKANSDNTGLVEKGKTNSVCSSASGVERLSPPSQEVSGLDIETNIFCPPPLYYTHMTQEKRPPLQGKITIKPQMHVPEELDGAFPEEKLVNPTTPTDLKHTNSAAKHESPAVLNPPHVQDIAASDPKTCHPQTEQGRINTIRQLPLLNALLVELSLLYNQPVASPTHIHPHLAWLYRTEDKKSPESSDKFTNKCESKKDKLSVGENEKSLSLQYKKNQMGNLKKGKYFEKNNGGPQKRVLRGKLLYGLTNTLKLRLKQTNPGMLVVHEKREQYRKMQAQMLDAKLRIPSSKVKVFSFAEQHQKPHQLPRDKYLESDTSFAKNSDSSKLISGVFYDLSTTKETKLKCATEKTVNYGENRTNNGSLEEIVSPANSVIQERFANTDILEGKMEMKAQSPMVFQQVAVVDKIVIDKEIDDKQVKTSGNDILTADVSESKPSKNSCSESISELKYSEDFTSPCYSEDFCSTEDTSRILQGHGSPGTENPKHSQYTSKSSETRLYIRKNSNEKSFILSPPFSAGSPVHSSKRSHMSKTQDKSLEEASTISTSDLSSYWTEEKENQIDQNTMHNSKVRKSGQDISVKLKTTDCKSVEKSQSTRTSQVSSYLPSNLSEHSKADHFEEDSDEIDSLNISKQCKDICELVMNKLPGYTM
ncbi:microtubule-associated protein 10 [Pteronotus mesoamericanus]|uniref:microtubule-associated protein 10 n=1 Tax=Pteronotus mesoamericanus TaxID=1884717 RepID=UPI0023EB4ECE|nr:microtubule-associated protein 10 [Pteronotus parnellii mesoamericanus]